MHQEISKPTHNRIHRQQKKQGAHLNCSREQIGSNRAHKPKRIPNYQTIGLPGAETNRLGPKNRHTTKPTQQPYRDLVGSERDEERAIDPTAQPRPIGGRSQPLEIEPRGSTET